MKTSLTRAANNAWEALWRTHNALLHQFQADDIWQQVSMREYDVLYTLASAPNQSLRLGELAEQTLMPQPSISRMVERLAQRGLVERQQVAQDRRGITVCLTPQGKQTQQQVGMKHARAVTARMSCALDEGQLQQFQELCERLLTMTDVKQGINK